MRVLRSNHASEAFEILKVLSSCIEASTIFSELFGSDGLVLLPRVTELIDILDESCLDGKSVDSLVLVATDNAHINGALLCQLDGLNNITAKFILHCEDRDQLELREQALLSVLLLGLVGSDILPLIMSKVLIGEGNTSKAVLSKLVDHCVVEDPLSLLFG